MGLLFFLDISIVCTLVILLVHLREQHGCSPRLQATLDKRFC
uniref:Uncharacterized protein n=1 Tax=Anguilla anguilla TaxID=7936 RepID=A0A0E9PH32_ANGAN